MDRVELEAMDRVELVRISGIDPEELVGISDKFLLRFKPEELAELRRLFKPNSFQPTFNKFMQTCNILYLIAPFISSEPINSDEDFAEFLRRFIEEPTNL